MGSKGYRSPRRVDAPGLSARHNRRSKLDRGRPDLGSPHGLPNQGPHDQTFELGAVIPASNGSKIANATQNHLGSFYGT